MNGSMTMSVRRAVAAVSFIFHFKRIPTDVRSDRSLVARGGSLLVYLDRLGDRARRRSLIPMQWI
jgi:hypothetical protein